MSNTEISNCHRQTDEGTEEADDDEDAEKANEEEESGTNSNGTL